MSKSNLAEKINKIDKEAVERLKCKYNPLYYIENYVKIPTQGGPALISEAGLWKKTNKYRLAIKVAWKFRKLILLFPRQTGKTTLNAAIMSHILNFYNEIQSGYVTIDKNRSTDFIRRLQYIYDHLPPFLKTPQKRSLSDRVTYFKLLNKSYLHTSGVSGNVSEGEVFRGLSLSSMVIDEAAYMDLNELLASVGFAYSKASSEAIKAGKPSVMILTTTPNGINDGGFYKIMSNATPVEELIVDPKDPLCDKLKSDEECYEILNRDGRNGYVLVKLNWWEVFDKKWYEDQKRLLNFDKRKIAQEVDLVFLGSSTSVLSDDIIAKMKPATQYTEKQLFNNIKIHFFDDLDPSHVYVIGVDVAASSAESQNADFSAIVIWDATLNKQVAELKVREPVLKNFGYAIIELIKFLIKVANIPEWNLKLVIERNSFGLGLIEHLLYDDEWGDLMTRILYKSKIRNEFVYGVQVTAANRPLIINTLLQLVNETPEAVVGPELIKELQVLEQKSNGRIEASRGFHDDVVFAAAHAVAARKELIKRGELEGRSDEKYGPKISLDQILSVVKTGDEVDTSAELQIIEHHNKDLETVKRDKQKEIENAVLSIVSI